MAKLKAIKLDGVELMLEALEENEDIKEIISSEDMGDYNRGFKDCYDSIIATLNKIKDLSISINFKRNEAAD